MGNLNEDGLAGKSQPENHPGEAPKEPLADIALKGTVSSPKQDNRFVTLFRKLYRGVQILGPLVKWIFVLLCFYFAIGAMMFPIWWHRFVFEGGMFDAKLIRFGFWYLYTLTTEMLPLGLVLPTILIFCIGFFLLRYGRYGKRVITKIPSPSGPVISFWILSVGITLISLTQVKFKYKSVF